MTLAIVPYHRASISARKLAATLGCKRVDRSYGPHTSELLLLINWGCASFPFLKYPENWNILNPPMNVRTAINKLRTFSVLKEVCPIPEFTDSKEIAKGWVSRGSTVIGRRYLQSKGGKGCMVFLPGDSVEECKLYTKYFNGKEEYRVHVIDNCVIDFTLKKRKLNFEGILNPHIRNFTNGWIFARKDVTLPDKVSEAAITGIRKLGLDFGACDIRYNVIKDQACLLEVNTAPGVEGTTLERYTDAFKNLYLKWDYSRWENV